MDVLECDEIDTHMCIRCKALISGLHNYLVHRKSSSCVPVSASTYFSHLQLQHIPRPDEAVKGDEENENEDDSDEVRSNHSSLSDEDIYRPPRNFTGGKWKPGCGPDQVTRNRYNLADYLSDSDESVDRPDSDSQTISNKIVKPCHVIEQPIFTCSTNTLDDTFWSETIERQPEAVKINTAKQSQATNKKVLNKIGETNSLQLLKSLLETPKKSAETVTCEKNLNKQMAFSCLPCLFYTNQSNNFLWHITTTDHLNQLDGMPVFNCIACHHNSYNVKSLMNHLRCKQSVHTNARRTIIVCKSLFGKNATKNQRQLTTKQTARKSITEHKHNEMADESFEVRIEGKFSCDRCKFKSNSEAALLFHYITDCEKNLINDEEVVNKSRNSNGFVDNKKNAKYECPRCNKRYSRRDLKYHLFTHTNEQPFQCEECGKRFSHINYLREHKKRHKDKNQVCQECGASFVFRKSLTAHMEIHKTERSRDFICSVCGTGHFSKALLAQHLKRHTPKSERKFKCDKNKCGKTFLHRSELREHQLVHRDFDDKNILCEKCPYKTSSIVSFRKHCRTHSGVKPFKCKYCNYNTALSSNLTRHTRIHTGQCPYQCPYCSYTCNTYENVRKHILKTKKHQGLSVYPCKNCDFGTNVFEEYKTHVIENHRDLYSENEIDNFKSHLYCKESVQRKQNNSNQLYQSIEEEMVHINTFTIVLQTNFNELDQHSPVEIDGLT